MKKYAYAVVLMISAGYAGRADAHGFGLSVNYSPSFTPLSLNVASQSAYLDQTQVNGGGPFTGPSNLFLEAFSNASSNVNGVFFPVDHGFAQTSGPWLPYTATYNVISPLYFSNGTGSPPAVAAQSGTYIDMYDLWAGNPQPVANPHPGAAFGNVSITGQSSFEAGYGVSLYDTHEMEKNLYIGSGPTYGEYGFAFDITVHFSDGVTLTTEPLVDIFAVADPSYGNFALNAPSAVQDAATLAIYNAATGVPEPSSLLLAALGGLACLGVRRARSKRAQN